MSVSAAGHTAGPWRTDIIPRLAPHGESPSIWITRDGEVYGVVRGGALGVYGSDWKNLSTWSHTLPGGASSSLRTRPDVEDPFIWQDDDNYFHIMVHNLNCPHYGICPSGPPISVGTHAYSLDVRGWRFAPVLQQRLLIGIC